LKISSRSKACASLTGECNFIGIVLPPFTLVGATTALAALAEPFRARFKLEERLEYYGEAEIRAVVERAAPRLS
jgi:Holliday junction resolvasome RuvABC ATP-dependent DNA helicase subunit